MPLLDNCRLLASIRRGVSDGSRRLTSLHALVDSFGLLCEQDSNQDHRKPTKKSDCVFYPEEGQVPVLLHVRDLQVLQHHGTVPVGPHHIGIVVVVGADKAQTVADALANCKNNNNNTHKHKKRKM